MTPTIPQQQYLTNWHDNFVNYIETLLGVVAGLMMRREVTEEDRLGLDGVKMILNGRDASDVERDLASGVVKQSTLDKIEKLNMELVDCCLAHIQMSPLVREFWKQMARIRIEREKASEKERLAALQIPVEEGL